MRKPARCSRAAAGGLVAGIRAVYSELFEEARRQRTPGQAIIATGHCYMVGGEISELSERKIQVTMPVLVIYIAGFDGAVLVTYAAGLDGAADSGNTRTGTMVRAPEA